MGCQKMAELTSILYNNTVDTTGTKLCDRQRVEVLFNTKSYITVTRSEDARWFCECDNKTFMDIIQ